MTGLRMCERSLKSTFVYRIYITIIQLCQIADKRISHNRKRRALRLRSVTVFCGYFPSRAQGTRILETVKSTFTAGPNFRATAETVASDCVGHRNQARQFPCPNIPPVATEPRYPF